MRKKLSIFALTIVLFVISVNVFCQGFMAVLQQAYYNSISDSHSYNIDLFRGFDFFFFAPTLCVLSVIAFILLVVSSKKEKVSIAAEALSIAAFSIFSLLILARFAETCRYVHNCIDFSNMSGLYASNDSSTDYRVTMYVVDFSKWLLVFVVGLLLFIFGMKNNKSYVEAPAKQMKNNVSKEDAVFEELQNLKMLLDKNAITEEEYQELKSEKLKDVLGE